MRARPPQPSGREQVFLLGWPTAQVAGRRDGTLLCAKGVHCSRAKRRPCAKPTEAERAESAFHSGRPICGLTNWAAANATLRARDCVIVGQRAEIWARWRTRAKLAPAEAPSGGDNLPPSSIWGQWSLCACLHWASRPPGRLVGGQLTVPEPVSVQAQRPSSQLQSTLVWPVLNCALSVSLSFSHASALLLGLHCLQPLIGRFGWSQQSDLLIDWPSLGQRAAGRPAVACAPPEARNSANPINLSATNQSSQIWSSPLSEERHLRRRTRPQKRLASGEREFD